MRIRAPRISSRYGFRRSSESSTRDRGRSSDSGNFSGSEAVLLLPPNAWRRTVALLPSLVRPGKLARDEFSIMSVKVARQIHDVEVVTDLSGVGGFRHCVNCGVQNCARPDRASMAARLSA